MWIVDCGTQSNKFRYTRTIHGSKHHVITSHNKLKDYCLFPCGNDCEKLIELVKCWLYCIALKSTFLPIHLLKLFRAIDGLIK
ncbi:hypothetical protein BLOT_013756, partial [Blomia tropicalis]